MLHQDLPAFRILFFHPFTLSIQKSYLQSSCQSLAEGLDPHFLQTSPKPAVPRQRDWAPWDVPACSPQVCSPPSPSLWGLASFSPGRGAESPETFTEKG